MATRRHWAMASVWGVVAALCVTYLPSTTAPSASAATGREAATAGSVPVGSASYAPPAGAIYVSTSGNDNNAGTVAAPLRTLAQAVLAVPAGGTVVLRGGTYEEGVVQIYKKLTLQNYPGEAVWLDGSNAVSGWVQDGTRWRKDGWTPRFDHSPSFTKGGKDGTGDWAFLNTNYPMAAHPDQVFFDGGSQRQVASLAQVTAGTFFLDEATSKLYVGSDPNGRSVRASVREQALNVRADGVTVRGIGLRRYATPIWRVGAITLEKPNATLENVVVSDNATIGISIQQANARLIDVTASSNGMLGVQGRWADNVTMSGILVAKNNTERFNPQPCAGGVKLALSRGITVLRSSFSDNYGHGFWEDMSVYNSRFVSNDFNRNEGNGIFLEISAKADVIDSMVLGNHMDGMKINNFSQARIWNNTIVGNARPIWLAQDSRRNNNPNDPAVDKRLAWPDPNMPWQLDYVSLHNNVLALPAYAARELLDVEDYSGVETAEQMHITANGNVYNRSSATSPAWFIVWSKQPNNAYIFKTLAEMQKTTGQEARGREYTGSAIVDARGTLSSTVTSLTSSIAVALPSDLAAMVNLAPGTLQVGAWGTTAAVNPAPAPTTSAASPTPTKTTASATSAATPTASPTATASQAPAATGKTVVRDDFVGDITGTWGWSDVGGAWTVPAWEASRYYVSNGVGGIRLAPGQGARPSLDSVSTTSSDLRVNVAFDRALTGQGVFVNALGRRVGADDYRLKARVAKDGTVSAWLVRSRSGAETVLSSTVVSGLKFQTGQTLSLRLQVVGTGSTTLRGKVWQAGTAEPAGWAVTATDSTASLQAAGSVGLIFYVTPEVTDSAFTVFTDEFWVTTVP